MQKEKKMYQDAGRSKQVHDKQHPEYYILQIKLFICMFGKSLLGWDHFLKAEKTEMDTALWLL